MLLINKLTFLIIVGIFSCRAIQPEEHHNEGVMNNLEPIFEKFESEVETFPNEHSQIQESSEVYNNATISESENSTNSNSTNHKFINCLKGFNGTTVQLVNDTELIKLLVPDPKISTEKNAAALCIAVLFYSKTCPFSSMAAPHFNALPRAFPDIKMVAINAMRYHLFNTQNGIVGVPTLLLFHNGRAMVRYNGSEYNLESFIKYIKRHTGIEPQKNSVVTSFDFTGPVVSSPAKESDMFLIISWLFIVICSCYYFSKSKLWKWMIETVQRNWRESEQHIQHEHMD